MIRTLGIWTDDGIQIANVLPSDNEDIDGRLLAAAPELYEAAKAALASIDDVLGALRLEAVYMHPETEDQVERPLKGAAYQLRAAIARADGKQEEE